MKVLFLDIEKCNTCQEIKCECSYPYHSGNKGINALIEYASFSYICRQCLLAPCVKSCPKEALEKVEDSILKRYNNRCISCKSCLLACPFGTIAPQAAPYLSSRCDVCVGRLVDNEMPVCVKSCSGGILKYLDKERLPKENVYMVNEHLAVHCVPWRAQQPQPKG